MTFRWLVRCFVASSRVAAVQLFLAVSMCFTASSGLEATVFEVTNTGDGPVFLCDADCTLREAVAWANVVPGHDIILVPAGSYTLSVYGSDEDEAAEGDLDITEDLTIAGEGWLNTSVHIDVSDRIFDIHPGASVWIQELSMLQGGPVSNGGGIRNQGSLTLVDAFVGLNVATSLGGGVHSTGSLTLIRSRIFDNEAGRGGGIYLSAGLVHIEESLIGSNVGNGDGGGLAMDGNADVRIYRSLISNNEAGINNGGALWLWGNATPCTVLLHNSTVTNNSSPGTHTTNEDIVLVNQVSLQVVHSTLSTTSDEMIRVGLVASAEFTGSIVSGVCEGPITSFGGSVESPGNTCGFDAAGDLSNVSSESLGLQPLANNGGETSTKALAAGSVAIDRGSFACPFEDQRGLMRVGACDAGAYEYGATIPALVFRDGFDSGDATEWAP